MPITSTTRILKYLLLEWDLDRALNSLTMDQYPPRKRANHFKEEFKKASLLKFQIAISARSLKIKVHEKLLKKQTNTLLLLSVTTEDLLSTAVGNTISMT
jgi:hypothetical protein